MAAKAQKKALKAFGLPTDNDGSDDDEDDTNEDENVHRTQEAFARFLSELLQKAASVPSDTDSDDDEPEDGDDEVLFELTRGVRMTMTASVQPVALQQIVGLGDARGHRCPPLPLRRRGTNQGKRQRCVPLVHLVEWRAAHVHFE